MGWCTYLPVGRSSPPCSLDTAVDSVSELLQSCLHLIVCLRTDVPPTSPTHRRTPGVSDGCHLCCGFWLHSSYVVFLHLPAPWETTQHFCLPWSCWWQHLIFYCGRIPLQLFHQDWNLAPGAQYSCSHLQLQGADNRDGFLLGWHNGRGKSVVTNRWSLCTLPPLIQSHIVTGCFLGNEGVRVQVCLVGLWVQTVFISARSLNQAHHHNDRIVCVCSKKCISKPACVGNFQEKFRTNDPAQPFLYGVGGSAEVQPFPSVFCAKTLSFQWCEAV